MGKRVSQTWGFVIDFGIERDCTIYFRGNTITSGWGPIVGPAQGARSLFVFSNVTFERSTFIAYGSRGRKMGQALGYLHWNYHIWCYFNRVIKKRRLRVIGYGYANKRWVIEVWGGYVNGLGIFDAHFTYGRNATTIGPFNDKVGQRVVGWRGKQG